MRNISIACLVLLATLPATPALAQTSASASATGSTTIVRPLALTQQGSLAFGRIVRPASGSATVTIAQDSDTVTASGGATALAGGTTARARFSATGEGGQSVSVTVPTTLTMTGGNTDTLHVTLLPDVAGPTTLGGSLGEAGGRDIAVGGTFALPATQASGAYSGNFTVSVAYE